MSNQYHETLTNSPSKITRTAAPKFASGPLAVNVIFTDVQSTAAALKFAQSFARELGARISLRAAIAVPFQLPLDQPQISVGIVFGPFRRSSTRIPWL